MQRIRSRTESAASFTVDESQRGRHRLYGKMGIYHEQVNQAAELSGNMSALRQLPKDQSNL